MGNRDLTIDWLRLSFQIRRRGQARLKVEGDHRELTLGQGEWRYTLEVEMKQMVRTCKGWLSRVSYPWTSTAVKEGGGGNIRRVKLDSPHSKWMLCLAARTANCRTINFGLLR